MKVAKISVDQRSGTATETPFGFKVPIMSILAGFRYVYMSAAPKHRQGHLYCVHRFVADVPSGQRKVLVECLTGPDAGEWFVVSEQNFSIRYRLAEEGHVPPEWPPKVQDADEGSGEVSVTHWEDRQKGHGDGSGSAGTAGI